MIRKHSCPSCGAELSAAAPEGLCPSCLLASALGDPALEAQPPLEAVRAGTLFGDYEILGVLGRGGMGVVYSARQVSLNRRVALKMVRSPQLATEADLARFQQEAEAAGRLDHRNIVPVYEIGEQDGVCYFTMKLVEGARSLAHELQHGPMEPHRAARLVARIAHAMHYAHQHGVIHRDIKPGNILLDAEGEPTLADFGLAKLQEAEISLTLPDRVIGTPQYISPEQLGAAGGDVTTAADVYSLGAVLYEMLSGRPPFQAESVHEVLRLVAEQEPRPPRSINPAIDRDLQTICLKCLEKDPRRRYASAHDLAEDLENWLEVRPIKARPISAAGRLQKWARRRPGVAVLTGALALVGVAAGGLVLYALQQSRALLLQALDGFTSKATALRVNDKPGHRWDALETISGALAVRGRLPAALPRDPTPSLRNEAIASFSLADMRPAVTWLVSDAEKTCLGEISPDFSLHAQSFPDGRIIIRSFPAQAEVAVIPGAGDPVGGVLRFSGDARLLAVATGAAGADTRDLTIRDVKSGRAVCPPFRVSMSAFDFTPDGARALLASGSELLEIEIAGGKILRRIPLKSAPHTVRCSPDGRSVAVSHPSGGVEVLDLRGEAQAPLLFPDSAASPAIAWHPKGRLLAMTAAGGRIITWDTARDPSTAFSWPAHNGAVARVQWHPNGRHLFSEGPDGGVTMWESRIGKREAGYPEARVVNTIQVSADGRRLGLLRQGNQTQVLELDDGAVVRYGEGHPQSFINSAAWNRGGHGTVLASAGKDAVKFWNRDGTLVGSLDVKENHSALWNDDSLIVTGGSGVLRWPLLKMHESGSRTLRLGPPEVLDARPGWKWASLSRDGRWLAVAHPARIALFDLATKNPPREFPGQAETAFASISPDGRWLASGTFHGNGVRLWSLPDGTVSRDLPVVGSANVGFNLDGELLITGCETEYVFWKVDTWARAHTVPTRLVDFYGAMAFSPRGTAVALESGRNRALIIHAPTLEELASPDFDRQRPLTFSPDGVLLVNADERQHLVFWDLAVLRQQMKSVGLDWRLPPLQQTQEPLVEAVETPR